ncbi:MAG: GHMP kinase [Burkholderiales bacterium]|nr:GHMP kinase [Flavobacterium sp.]
MKQTFYSNGKLLITGEYAVLNGAKALALPTKFGQDLTVEPGINAEISWNSFDSDGSLWFEQVIPFTAIIQKEQIENESLRNTLIAILHEAYLINPDFLITSAGYIVTTQLTFSRFWGLGTSSTLINNIAQWAKVDAFRLLQNSFGGSGYDIACAQHPTPILYQLKNGKPKVEEIRFEPQCSKNLYFVYLNKKQNSRTAMEQYFKKKNNQPQLLIDVDQITTTIVSHSDFETLTSELEKHERCLSKVLEIPTVKESLFSDFKGTIKSLGAWGGDFVLAVSRENPTAYFSSKGFETVIPYSKMIL